MNLSLLKNRPVFYIILSGFIIMVFVELALLNSALKGKEKDFNDKIFYLVSFYEEHVVKSGSIGKLFVSDEAGKHLVQTIIKKGLDSLFNKNEIPTDYVYAIGKAIPETAAPDLTIAQRSWAGNNLIWSSDPANNPGLISTKLRLSNLGPMGADLYYLKIFFPSKSTIVFNALLPLIVLSVLTLITLFLCFLTLLSIIKKQTRLAETKSDFISNMTHELKTPLFTISIASKMLGEQEPIRENKKFLSYIESIQQETGRLTSLVEKVLQTTALEKKQLQLDKKDIDIHALIHSSVKNLELIREQQQASIEINLGASMHFIHADETHIESVIYSLVDNAFKYSNGPAHITIATQNKDDQVLISFIDKGIGFDVETKSMIFERFFRASTGNLHNVKGYGIGLSYVRSSIEAHDGSITVNSAVGKGSEFILSLPFINYGSKSGDSVGGG